MLLSTMATRHMWLIHSLSKWNHSLPWLTLTVTTEVHHSLVIYVCDYNVGNFSAFPSLRKSTDWEMMVQMTKCIPCKYEDWNSEPTVKPRVMVSGWSSSGEDWSTQVCLWSLLSQQSHLLDKALGQWQTWSQNWVAPEEWHLRLSCDICICARTCACVYLCTHIKKIHQTLFYDKNKKL